MVKRATIDLDSLAQEICDAADIDGLFLTSDQGLVLAESRTTTLDLEGLGAVITGVIIPNVMNVRREHGLSNGTWFRLEIEDLPIFSIRYFCMDKNEIYCIVVSYKDVDRMRLGEIEGRVKEKILSVL